MARTLYICYFGVREPLVQTQVLPYLRELGRDAALGLHISLLTFEPKRGPEDLGEFSAIKEGLAAEGIEWHWLPYHKRPSAIATAWDIFRGAFFIWRRIAKYDLLHGRVHVPTLMAALARKFSLRKPKLLFDIRGFFPEEYTDAGIWPEGGVLYRGAKRVERRLMQESDGFVVLTEKARAILFPEMHQTGNVGGHNGTVGSYAPANTPASARNSDEVTPKNGTQNGRPVEVIPCCVDFARFAAANDETRHSMRIKLGIADRRVLAYVGSFGGWYLTEETADFFGAFREKYANAFAMVLTQSKPEMIKPLLGERGFTENDLFIERVSAADVPCYLSAANLAVSFIKECYSKQASSPTKNAEYLACGLPIIANSGVGDVDKLIEQNGVGALLREFSHAAYLAALDEVDRLGDIADRCRETARREFDLKTVGGERYRRIYRKLLP